MIILIIIFIVAIIGPWIAPYDYTAPDYANWNQKPSAEHIMGTDPYGRDIFSRLIIGTRYSVPIGFLVVIFAFAVGGTLGAIAAYYGGKVDMVIMRILDVFQSIPPMLMAIAVVAVLGGGIANLVISIVISSLPARARIVRASILTVKRNDYIESAKAMGASKKRQLIKFMLPNALGPILTSFTFSVATAILTISSLSYIGLGITEPAPEWGAMLSAGKAYLRLPIVTANARRVISIEYGEGVTAVDGQRMTPAESDGSYYTLNGQRMTGTPSKAGVYIKDGHKVIIK
jgi:peptide/nickel transport system permease protein